MKKLILVVTFAIALLGCSGTNTPLYIEKNLALELNAVDKNDDLSLFTRPADDEMLIKLHESEQDYVVYTYQNNCSACQIFSPILKEFLLENHYLIYSYNVNDNDYLSLNEKYPYVYSVKATPNLSFFYEGEKIGELSSSRYSDLNKFSISFSNYVYPNAISDTNSVETLFESLNNKVSYIIYLYGNEESLQFYDKYIFNDFKDEKTLNIYRLNISSINEEEMISLKEKFDLNVLDKEIYYEIDENQKGIIEPTSSNYIEEYKALVSSLSVH